MPERSPHTVYVAVDIEAYDWMHATECVRAELDAMRRMGAMSPMFDDVVTLNFTGREERLEIAGKMYYRAKPHEVDDVEALRILQGAWIMGTAETGYAIARNNLLQAIGNYYRYVTGRSIDPRPRV